MALPASSSLSMAAAGGARRRRVAIRRGKPLRPAGGSAPQSGQSPPADLRPPASGGDRHGVFHNDVIAVSNRQVLFCHEQAFADQTALLQQLAQRVPGFTPLVVPASRVSVAEAVATYLFNSQLLSRADGSMALILPQEAQEHAGVWEYLNELLAGDNPIADLRVFDLRESMPTAAVRRACACGWC